MKRYINSQLSKSDSEVDYIDATDLSLSNNIQMIENLLDKINIEQQADNYKTTDSSVIETFMDTNTDSDTFMDTTEDAEDGEGDIDSNMIIDDTELNDLLDNFQNFLIEKDRKKAINIIKKYMVPIFNKRTLQSRIRLYMLMQRLLDKIDNCISIINKRIVLTKNGEPTVFFSKKIGTESKYGVVYMSTGWGFSKLLKFATKFMAIENSNSAEIDILNITTNAVLAKNFVNLPITYKIMTCYNPCFDNICPMVTNVPYYIIINELADYDIKTWFNNQHTEIQYESVLMQLLVSLHYLHSFGYAHNDTHLGNFLIHEIKPGGYWRYNIHNQDIYIPNVGYLLVLWDFGLATKIDTNINFIYDYTRPLYLMKSLNKSYNIPEINSESINNLIDTLLIFFIHRVMNINDFQYDTEVFKQIFKYIQTSVIDFKYIYINSVPNDFLLNVIPFVISKKQVVSRITKRKKENDDSVFYKKSKINSR